MASTWIKFSDDFFDHPKAIGLTPTAVTLYVRALCWSSKHLTDGKVPEAVVASWKVNKWRAAADELCADPSTRVGQGSAKGETRPLWSCRDHVYEIHDYLDYQRSAAEARKLKEKRAEAGAKGGAAKAAKAKQTPSKVLEAGLAEKRREDSPSSPPQISGEKPSTAAAYGGEEELTKAVAQHMARCDLERERVEGRVIAHEAAWLRKAAENREANHAEAIAYEISRRDAGVHYALHVEIAEAIDTRCGPADRGSARATRLAAEAEARRLEHEANLAATRSNPDAIRAGAAAARAALHPPAA